ncbi:MAG: hypothetical protein ACFFCM_13675 [Promethearchaeota archaeon]
MEVFDIQDTGEYELVTDGNSLKDVLREENVYIILNHDWKICWIWIGKTCSNVRKKFAGAQASRGILNERQLAYSVKTVDSGDEPQQFKDILSEQIRKTYKAESPSLEHVKIQQKVLQNNIPPECVREAVLINNRFYVAVELKAMGTTTHKFEPSEFLPEGVTDLPEDYIARLFVKHGKVEAVEFLKKNQHLATIEDKTEKMEKKAEKIKQKPQKVEEEPKKIEEKPKKVEETKVSIEEVRQKYNVARVVTEKGKKKEN